MINDLKLFRTSIVVMTLRSITDDIKTRLQVHGLPQLTNSNMKGSVIVGSLVEHIFKNEGLRGMNRGLLPAVLALLLNWAAMEISVKSMESGIGIRKNQTLICAPIMRDTVDQMVELMHKAKLKGSDRLEVRLDHMKTFNPDVDIGKMIKE